MLLSRWYIRIRVGTRYRYTRRVVNSARDKIRVKFSFYQNTLVRWNFFTSWFINNQRNIQKRTRYNAYNRATLCYVVRSLLYMALMKFSGSLLPYHWAFLPYIILRVHGCHPKANFFFSFDSLEKGIIRRNEELAFLMDVIVVAIAIANVGAQGILRKEFFPFCKCIDGY